MFKRKRNLDERLRLAILAINKEPHVIDRETIRASLAIKPILNNRVKEINYVATLGLTRKAGRAISEATKVDTEFSLREVYSSLSELVNSLQDKYMHGTEFYERIFGRVQREPYDQFIDVMKELQHYTKGVEKGLEIA